MKIPSGEDSKITILYMIDVFGDGGTEKHLTQLAMLLDKSRYRPVVLTFRVVDDRLMRAMSEAGVTVIDFPVGRYYTPVALRKLIKLIQLIRQEKAHIVQTFHFKSDTYGVTAARLAGVRHVVSSRRDLGDLKYRWHLFLNRRFDVLIDGFIVVADAIGRVLQEKEGVSQSRIKTIYNGVDTIKYCPPTELEARNAREATGFQPEDFVVGTVSWFRPEKDHALLLEALDLLRRTLPKMRLLWVGGNGALFRHLQDEVVRRGLEGRVIFAGAKEDVRECLRCCDVAALVPSKNEGFSNAVLEKMAMGIPLIVTDTGGNAEAVHDGYNGFVIPPGSARRLADKLAELYRNPVLRQLMGRRSRERAESVFPLEKMVLQHEEYYKHLARNTAVHSRADSIKIRL